MDGMILFTQTELDELLPHPRRAPLKGAGKVNFYYQNQIDLGLDDIGLGRVELLPSTDELLGVGRFTGVGIH